jgi:zinc transport system permease protein
MAESIFQYDFFTNALVAAVLASVTCGIVGTYIVSKRIVFISGGLSHASFGGIGIGYFLGWNPIIAAAVFAVLSALGIEFMSKRISIREDSAIAILWAFGMAVGIIFIYITPGYAPNLMSYLFGSIISVSGKDILMMLILSIVIILFMIFLFKPVVYIAFDEEFARTRDMPVNFINYAMMILIALTIVVNIRVVGIILVISMLTIPQTILNMFTNRYIHILTGSILIGFVSAVGGLLASYSFNIPSGASIIFILVLLFLLAHMIKKIKPPTTSP